jgi:hypothetical protein
MNPEKQITDENINYEKVIKVVADYGDKALLCNVVSQLPPFNDLITKYKNLYNEKEIVEQRYQQNLDEAYMQMTHDLECLSITQDQLLNELKSKMSFIPSETVVELFDLEKNTVTPVKVQVIFTQDSSQNEDVDEIGVQTENFKQLTDLLEKEGIEFESQSSKRGRPPKARVIRVNDDKWRHLCKKHPKIIKQLGISCEK